MAIEDLARRHEGYGVVAEHYAAVGEALIWTLEQGLGEAFVPTLKRAWLTAYSALSRAMIGTTQESVRVH